MKRLVLIVLLACLALFAAACSTSDEAETGIVVENVRANMTLPSDTGSFWMSISNRSDTDDVLVGAEVTGCGVIELHDMVMENDVMVMRQVAGDGIVIPAGETVALEPGGLHVMCLQKEAPLTVGAEITIALHFQESGTIEMPAMVVEPAMSGGMEGMNEN